MDDYYNTAMRMWDSASLLFSDVSKAKSSLFNVCYLTGYVLECYGKLVLGPTAQNGNHYGHSLYRINQDLLSLLSTSKPPAKYAVDLTNICPLITNGSQKWHPNNRYVYRSGYWDNNQTAQSYLDQSKEVRKIILKMKLDGVI